MRRSTIFLSTAAVLVLSAGLVVGRLSAKLSAQMPGHFQEAHQTANHDRGWFHDQLDLSADQKQKMDAVWADVRQQMDKAGEHRRGLTKDRDAAIHALLSPEQAAAYDKIYSDYRAHQAELDADREQVMHIANDRSRALLTPDQQVKWDAMAKDMHDHHGPGGPQGRNHGGGAGQPAVRMNEQSATTGPS